jgi:hypothetical protein
MQRYRGVSCDCIEDWLLRVANARGARVVTPANGNDAEFQPPPLPVLSNEELVAAICHLQGLDRPQMLRLAAQLISRNAADPKRLRLVAERERVQPVLAELARQAIRVDPGHAAWQEVYEAFQGERPLREPLLHWTRLAEPIMKYGRCNAAGWRLVA